MHPRNRRDGKLQIARDHFTVFFQRVDNNVHAAGRVCSQTDLVGLGVDECRYFRSHFFAPREPVVPVQIAVVLHLLVVTDCGLGSGSCQWASGGGVEINAVGSYRKLLADVAPFDHAYKLKSIPCMLPNSPGSFSANATLKCLT